MRPYLLFAGWNFYPSGGWDDYIGRYDTIEEAVAIGEQKKPYADGKYNFDWWHIVDLQSNEIVLHMNTHRNKNKNEKNC